MHLLYAALNQSLQDAQQIDPVSQQNPAEEQATNSQGEQPPTQPQEIHAAVDNSQEIVYTVDQPVVGNPPSARSEYLAAQLRRRLKPRIASAPKPLSVRVFDRILPPEHKN